MIDVRQGYTKCSVCPIDENSIITADCGIAKKARQHGFDVLEVSNIGVNLDPLSCGFIGGASGVFHDAVYFCGNLDAHPDAESIKAFCKSHNKQTVSLSDEPLYDVGTMFFFE